MVDAVRTGNDLLHLVTFVLGDELYGIDILLVQEINRVAQITRVPNAPAFVEGVINLRGQVIPVVDLRKRLGLPAVERDHKARVIVVELLGAQRAGFLVDSVEKVLRIPQSTVDPPPSITLSVGAEYIKGVGRLDGDRLLVLLDFEKILSNREQQSLKGMAPDPEPA